MNITIIKNANIYAPEKLGIKDLLVCNGKIVMIDDQIDLTGVKHSMIDAGGLIVTPGFNRSTHAHYRCRREKRLLFHHPGSTTE